MFNKKILTLFLIFFIALFFGVLYFGSSTNNKDVNVKEIDNNEKKVDEEKEIDYFSIIKIDDSPSIGAEDASVVMVNYSSYYCPVCSRFKKEVYPLIKEKYIDTGKILYVYKDAGSPDDNVFLAAHCASDSDKFWEYQDALVNNGVMNEDDLFSYAEEFELDMDEFSKCLEEGCCKHIIEQSQKEMEELGITAVPYFVINGVSFAGLKSFEELSNIIDKELSKYEN